MKIKNFYNFSIINLFNKIPYVLFFQLKNQKTFKFLKIQNTLFKYNYKIYKLNPRILFNILKTTNFSSILNNNIGVLFLNNYNDLKKIIKIIKKEDIYLLKVFSYNKFLNNFSLNLNSMKTKFISNKFIANKFKMFKFKFKHFINILKLITLKLKK